MGCSTVAKSISLQYFKNVVDISAHGRRKDFFQGGAKRSFFSGAAKKIFAGEAKVAKFHFNHSKLRKQPYLLKI